MRTLGLSLFIVLFVSLAAFGQVKIGDNPQNIDPSAVLELESTTKTLIITRVTTAQMEAIAPSVGALVYNTDLGCVHYYNGAAWVNLCVEGNVAITTEPIVNSLSTIVLTPTAGGNNLEVAPNSIRSEQIVDGGVNGVDIQNNSIGPNKLADNSVNRDKLSENAVGLEALDTDEVTLGSLINDAGFITSAEVVSPDPANDITDNGGAFFDQQPLVDAIAGNTAAIAADGDTNANNEIQSLGLNGNLLSITGSNTVDLTVFNNSGTDNQTLALNSNILGISNGNTVNLAAYVNTDNQVLAIAGNQLSISGGNVVTIPASNGSDTQIIPGTGIAITGNGTIATPYQITNTFTEVDGSTSNELQDLQFDVPTNILTLTNPATPGNQVDLSALAGGGGSTELADQLTIVGNGTLGNEFEVADGAITTAKIQPLAPAPATDYMLVTTPAGIVAWAPTGGTPTAADVIFTPYLTLGSTNTQAAIEELKDELSAAILLAGAADPTDELITNFNLTGTSLNIAEGANVLPPVDLDPIFATNVELTNAIAASNQNINDVLNTGNDAGGVVITNLGAPVAPQDATTRLYVDNAIANADPDGSETILNAGPNIALVGNGTLATPYVISGTDTDDQILSVVGNQLTISEGNTINLPSGDGTETIVTAGTNIAVLGDGSIVTPYIISGTDTDDQTLSIIGNQLTISEGNTVAIPIAANDGAITNIAASITSLAFTGINGAFNGSVDLEALVDASVANNGYLLTEIDGDPANEIQVLSLVGADLTLSNGGGTVNIPGGVNDGVVSNIAVAGTQLAVTGANGGFNGNVDLEPLVDAAAGNNGYLIAEVDGDPANEIQVLSIVGTDLTLSNGGGTVPLPSGANLSNTDLTLTAPRTHSLAGNNLVFDGSGNIGIGNLPGAPQDKLDVDGSVRARNGFAANIGTAGNPGYGFYTETDMGMFRAGVAQLGFSTEGIEVMRIDENQNVGIGETNPIRKLHVGGDLQVDGGVWVGATQEHPDYVFEKYFKGNSNLNKEYRFQTLKEIEAFVKKNHHLPGIKSAAEVKKEGFWNLSESNLQNLEKIEELFLHAIDQEKQIDRLNKENDDIAKELEALRKELEAIKKLIKKTH
ncbi:MAG: hypothetical protein WBN18_11005 [Flavobacteriaceae bacterium]